MTTSYGVGALRALGAEVLDAAGAPVDAGGYGLMDAVQLDLSDVDPWLAATGILVACNPHNLLTAKLIEHATGRDLRLVPGGGADLVITIGSGAREVYEAGIDAFAGILAEPVPLAGAIEHAAELVTDATERALRLVLVGAALR